MFSYKLLFTHIYYTHMAHIFIYKFMCIETNFHRKFVRIFQFFLHWKKALKENSYKKIEGKNYPNIAISYNFMFYCRYNGMQTHKTHYLIYFLKFFKIKIWRKFSVPCQMYTKTHKYPIQYLIHRCLVHIS